MTMNEEDYDMNRMMIVVNYESDHSARRSTL